MSAGFRVTLALLGVIVLAGVLWLYRIRSHQQPQEAMHEGKTGILNMTLFIEALGERLERIDGVVTRIRETVGRKDWIPAGRGETDRKGSVQLVLWAEALRGDPEPRFDHAQGPVAWIDRLMEWVRAPETIAATYAGEYEHDPEYTRMIRDAEADAIAVIEVLEMVEPGNAEVDLETLDANNLEFVFETGMVRFRVGVFDAKTGELIAHEEGEALNHAEVSMGDDLKEDLRRATEGKARSLAGRLLGAAW